MKCCVVVPCYRDADRLGDYLPGLCDALSGFSDVSVLVVDDGSPAAEAAELSRVCSAVRARHRNLIEPLCLATNVGKGGAIYAGWDAVPHAEWLAFADADGATSAGEVLRLLTFAWENGAPFDAVLGSRIKMLGRNVERTFVRHLTGRVYATCSSILTGYPVYDSQCGCKLVRGSAYRSIRPLLEETRFAFDMDLISHLLRAGSPVAEFPIDWIDVPGSKVSVLRDGFRMLIALVHLRGRLRKDSRNGGQGA